MASQTKTSRQPTRMLVRGESIVASTGLAVATILVVVIAAVGGWLIYTQRQAARESTRAQVEGWASLLASTAAPMVERGDTRELQTMLAQFALQHGLKRCRVVNEQGRVAADAIKPKVSVRRGSGPAELPVAEDLPDDPAVVCVTVPIGGVSGKARVEMGAALTYPRWTGWDVQAGIGGIGAVGLVAFLFVYRRLRGRLRAIGAIREALLAVERGERASSALTVSANLGAEAGAWNQLLAERERLHKDLVTERARETLVGRGELNLELVQACDALWQGLMLVEENLKIKYANGAAAVFLRARRETLAGSSLADHLTDSETLDAVRAVASGQVRRKTTLELRRDDAEGGGILRLSVRPVRRDDSAAAILVIEDITQQRVADEARNSFVAQATHELRTPLTNIRLYVEQAIELGDSDATQRARCLNVINQESRRLERIVGDMLSVSEIEAGSFKLRTGEVRLDALFEELKEDYQAQAADKKIDLIFDLPPKYPPLQGDRDKVMLALHNLLGNAMKYTPEGGGVTVRVAADSRLLTVEVTDTGIGIAPDETELIFERFYRSKDKRLGGITGTGLGLTLAREVIRLHGGDITVRSQLNQGSTFTLSIPLVAEAA
jgi:signal transduction histidine kinase